MRNPKHMHPVPDLRMLILASDASFRCCRTRPVAKRYFRLAQSSDPSLLGWPSTPPVRVPGFPAKPSSACLACESPPVSFVRTPWWLAQGIGQPLVCTVSLAPAKANNHGRHLNPIQPPPRLSTRSPAPAIGLVLAPMAANYWESTQRKHWQFTKDELANVRQRLEDDDPGLVQMFPLPQLRHLNIYFNQRKPTLPFPFFCCLSTV